MKVTILMAAAASLFTASAMAQNVDMSQSTPDALYQLAVESGVCEDRGVLSAAYNAVADQIEVVCEKEAAGVVPLLGGLGGGGIALVAGGLALALSSTSGT